MVKRILTVFTWSVSFAGLLLLLGFARQTHYHSPVVGLDLKIEHQPDGSFLPYNKTYAEISEMIGANRTKSLGQLKLMQIKQQLLQNPYVAEAKAYSTIERTFKIEIVERKPFLRFYTNTDQSFYVDDRMVIFPIHPDYVARVLIANGNIGSLPIELNQAVPISKLINRKHPIIQVAAVAQAINRDEFASVLIDQIFIADDSLIELSPKIGDAPILIGDTSHLNEKITSIAAFYRSQANKPQLHQYKIINASIKNQIVCTKKDNL